jgi:hypothetical protein
VAAEAEWEVAKRVVVEEDRLDVEVAVKGVVVMVESSAMMLCRGQTLKQEDCRTLCTRSTHRRLERMRSMADEHRLRQGGTDLRCTLMPSQMLIGPLRTCIDCRSKAISIR